jgi:hypothetical protein
VAASPIPVTPLASCSSTMILFPLIFLMNKEEEAGRKVRWFFD